MSTFFMDLVNVLKCDAPRALFGLSRVALMKDISVEYMAKTIKAKMTGA